MITYQDIVDTQKRIASHIYHCHLVRNGELSSQYNSSIYFKPENFQLTGSFKIRGALSKILTLTDKEKKRGIVTASSGNHALGVAYAAQLVGAKAIIVMPEDARERKVAGVKALGSDVVQCGETPLDRYEEVYRIIDEKGCTLVHSCDDPHVITGQGTVGLEIVQEMEHIDSVIVPLGAGALIGGIGCAVKQLSPKTRIIGVEPENIPRFTESLKLQKPVTVPAKETIADGLCMTKTYPSLYELIDAYVDDVVTASEESILEATRAMLDSGKMVCEPSAAIGLAGVISGKIELAVGGNHVIVLTGGNIAIDSLYELINE